MDLMKAVQIATSGLRTQSGRMKIIAENLANSNSTAQKSGGEPYRRRIAVVENRFDDELGAYVARSGKYRHDSRPFPIRFDPGHPGADDKGYVKLSNVNPLIETVDLREAQRSYEANLNVVTATRRMLARTLDILKA